LLSCSFRCRILLGLNICQGCSHISCGQLYDEWENGVAFTTFFLTVKVKRLLRRHYEQVVAPHVASGSIDEKRLWSTNSIATMDEVYTCRSGWIPKPRRILHCLRIVATSPQNSNANDFPVRQRRPYNPEMSVGTSEGNASCCQIPSLL
ncbi:hypothetical protein COOONC_10925, partial [Cooperia oncophora]